MRIALGIMLILICFLNLLISTCMFKEVSNDKRREYYSLKRQIKETEGVELQIIQEVEYQTLSGSDEWTRMKDGPPNTADVRATL